MPVMSIVPCVSLDEAIVLAYRSEFGLNVGMTRMSEGGAPGCRGPNGRPLNGLKDRVRVIACSLSQICEYLGLGRICIMKVSTGVRGSLFE
ncbi:hypothetical protein [Paenibacillus popilliae]|uniref:hypothetical protein n=1 Tax=Paenibacillus popilliae TaxID=78057 RepID=UPI00131F05D0|nr:hypothetical protein [Paenibacillus popilliae]